MLEAYEQDCPFPVELPSCSDEGTINEDCQNEPLVFRIAGLPADFLNSSSGQLCSLLSDKLVDQEDCLRLARWKLLSLIEKDLPSFSKDARRFLLKTKRNCYNDRSLRLCYRAPGWAYVERVDENLAELIVQQEKHKDFLLEEFEKAYRVALSEERDTLQRLGKNKEFVRGIAVGRPGLVTKMRKHSSTLHTDDQGLALKKYEKSLLRFVCRAASKLSANSTLTYYALGATLQPGAQETVLPQGACRARSVVRLNRPEAEHLEVLLLRNRAVREDSTLELNRSLESIGDGKYRFIRIERWELNPESGVFELAAPVRVTADLKGQGLTILLQSLEGQALAYRELVALLTEAGKKEAENLLDYLVEIGLLVLLGPWLSSEDHLEGAMARYLSDLSPSSKLRGISLAFERLLLLEQSLCVSEMPEETIAAIQSAYLKLMEKLAKSSGTSKLSFQNPHIFEDVILTPEPRSLVDDEVTGNGGEGEAGLGISKEKVAMLLSQASLLVRYAEVFNLHHDFRLTMAAWWSSESIPERGVSLKELARRFAPLWKQYCALYSRRNESAIIHFNPLGLAQVEMLHQLRLDLLSASERLIQSTGDHDHIDPDEFSKMLSKVPCDFRPSFEACAFVQPEEGLDGDWVLNKIHYGTGRYFSRVLALLEGESREHLLLKLRNRATLPRGDEQLEFLEIQKNKGYLMCAHPPLARAALAIQGQRFELPDEAHIRLDDLWVALDPAGQIFKILGPEGIRYLPVNLSSLSDTCLSPMLRFLLAFGPGELRGVLPFARLAASWEEGEVFSRLKLGRLVIRRRTWHLNVGELREALRGEGECQKYLLLQEWRKESALPRQVFYYEHTFHGSLKPQFLDFSSPALCQLFAFSLRSKVKRIRVEEALPRPDQFPVTDSAGKRASELLLDGFLMPMRGQNWSGS